MTDVSDAIHQRRFTPFLQSIRDLVEDTKPDVAVVTGDTVPPPFVNSLNAFFSSLFPAELPVVATLGNAYGILVTIQTTISSSRPVVVVVCALLLRTEVLSNNSLLLRA